MVPIVYLIAVGVAMGICAALFRPAEDAFLPQAVPADQLSAVVVLNGFLFAVTRFVPFLADAVVHAVACFLLLFLRVPPREVRPTPTHHPRREIMVGLRWVWAHRRIRITPPRAIVLNLFITTSSSSCWHNLGEYGPGRSARAVRCQSRPPDHGETAAERRLRLVAGDAVLQGGLVRLDDLRQRVSSEWIVPTPFAEGVR